MYDPSIIQLPLCALLLTSLSLDLPSTISIQATVVFKLFTLTMKTVSKPLAGQFENYVMNHPVLRGRVISFAQVGTIIRSSYVFSFFLHFLRRYTSTSILTPTPPNTLHAVLAQT